MHLKRIFAIFFIILTTTVVAQNALQYSVETQATVGAGDSMPYFFFSNNHGVASSNVNSGYLRAQATKDVEVGSEWSMGYGADIIAAYNNDYSVRLQQLYVDLNYGWFALMAGSKEMGGVLKSELSSGGWVWSGNARPIPQIRVGFNKFHAIPGTNGWLQMWGDVAYGYFLDSSWLDEFDLLSRGGYITTNSWYHQKRLFARSKESNRFVVTIGGEFACQFGGDKQYYSDGELVTISDTPSFSDFLKVIIPIQGSSAATFADEQYYSGNHLGAWHFMGEYKLTSEQLVKGYFEWMFDDGSGIGKQNGFDGLWGVEYQGKKNSLLSNAVVEYLQTTNQSGQIHWAPADVEGTELTDEATGNDNYYNNHYYNGWAHYGRANGNALLRSPIYNTSGTLSFQYNRVKAIHVALAGCFTQEIGYTLRYCYDTSWGTPIIPLEQLSSHMSQLSIDYTPRQLSGWKFATSIALDRGDLFGDNLGMMFSVSKSGIIR